MKNNLFIFVFTVIILASPLICVGQGFFKPIPEPVRVGINGLPTTGSSSERWEFRPSVTIPALRIVQAVNNDNNSINDAKISAQILTSVGGGVSLQKIRFDEETKKWKSIFSWSPITVLLSGNLQEANATLNISPATSIGFFNNLIMIGAGYDLGNVNGKSRWFGMLSVGVNLNN